MSFYPRSNLKKNLATTSLLIWQFAAFCGTANAIDTSDPERKESNSVSRLVNRQHDINLELGPVEIEDWGNGPSETEVMLGQPLFESRKLTTLERLTLIRVEDEKLQWHISVSVRTPNSPLTIQNGDDQLLRQNGGKLLYRKAFQFANEVSAFNTEMKTNGMHVAGVYLHFKDRFVTITYAVPQELYDKSRDDIQRFLNGVLPIGSEDAVEAIEDSQLYFEDITCKAVLSYLPPWDIKSPTSLVKFDAFGVVQIGNATKISNFNLEVSKPEKPVDELIESYRSDILETPEFKVVEHGKMVLNSHKSEFFNTSQDGKLCRFQILANEKLACRAIMAAQLHEDQVEKKYKGNDPFLQFGRFSSSSQ